MRHIDIKQIDGKYKIYEKMSSLYATDIQQFLDDKGSHGSKSPYYIYDYLAKQITAKKLISISLEEMDNIIEYIQTNISGWEEMGAKNCDGKKWNPKNDICKERNCKKKRSCIYRKVHNIHNELKVFLKRNIMLG